MDHDRPQILFPAAPPGGGYLVLNAAQIGNWDLVCLIKSTYPRTKIIVNKPIPVDYPTGSIYTRLLTDPPPFYQVMRYKR